MPEVEIERPEVVVTNTGTTELLQDTMRLFNGEYVVNEDVGNQYTLVPAVDNIDGITPNEMHAAEMGGRAVRGPTENRIISSTCKWVYVHLDDCIECECDGNLYHGDTIESLEIQQCIESSYYYFTENMRYGQTSTGEGWFRSRDAIYCNDTDEHYYDSVVANDCDVYYCDGCQEYRSSDDHDFDYCENDGGSCSEPHFNYTYTQSVSKRFKLTGGMKYTFGVELETSGPKRSGQHWRGMSNSCELNVKSVNDGSITGYEYVTGVLNGDIGVKELQYICEKLQQFYLVNKSCGVHVHIGGATFNRRFSILAIMLGLQIQDELYDMLPKSRRTGSYCYPIKEEQFKTINLYSKVLYPRSWKRTMRLLAEYVYGSNADFCKSNCKKTNNPNGHYSSTRYKWLNLNNCSYKDGGDTIEFRQHSGSLDFKKIYNWVLICMCFVRYVENNPRDIHNGHIGKGPIVTLRTIIREGLPKKMAQELIAYVDSRMEHFGN